MDGIILPKLPWQELTLEPEGVPTRGRGTDTRDLEGLIALGGPVSIPVTETDVADDEQARTFIRARSKDFSFDLVHFACSFRPINDEPFDTVTLQVQLMRGDGIDEPKPIALSMKPMRLEEPVEVSRTVKLGATLKILEAGIEEQEKRTLHKIFLEGTNELRPDPMWELRRTSLTDIRGSQRFILVVQSPKDASSKGAITVSAKISRMRFGILPYAAVLPDRPPISFIIRQGS